MKKVHSSIIRKNGKYFISRPGKDDEPITEFEVRSLLGGMIERTQIDEEVDRLLKAIGIKLPPEVKRQIADRTHKAAREAGITRTGSMPNLHKLLK